MHLSYADLTEAHRHYGALRDIVIQRPGGWADETSLAKMRALCRTAAEAVDDADCRARLAVIDDLASDLYSASGHLKWERTQTSGRDFLRLRILRELNAYDARILALEETRHGAAQAQGDITVPYKPLT